MSVRIYICERCGRKPSVGNNKPHSQTRTKRWFRANVQKITVNGTTRFLCTRCIQLSTTGTQSASARKRQKLAAVAA